MAVWPRDFYLENGRCCPSGRTIEIFSNAIEQLFLYSFGYFFAIFILYRLFLVQFIFGFCCCCGDGDGSIIAESIHFMISASTSVCHLVAVGGQYPLIR